MKKIRGIVAATNRPPINGAWELGRAPRQGDYSTGLEAPDLTERIEVRGHQMDLVDEVNQEPFSLRRQAR